MSTTTPADPLYTNPAVTSMLAERRAEREAIDLELQDLADTEALLTEQLGAVNKRQNVLLERRGSLGLVPTNLPIAVPTSPPATPPTTAGTPPTPTAPAPAPAPVGNDAATQAAPTPAPTAPAPAPAGNDAATQAAPPTPTRPSNSATQAATNEPKGLAKIKADIKDHPIASGVAGCIAGILVILLIIGLVFASIGSANAGEGGWIVVYVLVGLIASILITFGSFAVALNVAKPKSHDMGRGTIASDGITTAPPASGTDGTN
jgi:hypothetical protein